VISQAVVLLMFAALFQVADAVAMCGMGSLRGYKDTFGPMLIVFVAYLAYWSTFWIQPSSH